MRLGELDAAEKLLEQARKALEKKLGPKSTQLGFALFAQGELQLYRKQPALAVAMLESDFVVE